jgi:hypothetical protein
MAGMTKQNVLYHIKRGSINQLPGVVQVETIAGRHILHVAKKVKRRCKNKVG